MLHIQLLRFDLNWCFSSGNKSFPLQNLYYLVNKIFYLDSLDCVRFSDNTSENFYILLFLNETGYMWWYVRQGGTDGHQSTCECETLLVWKCHFFVRLSDVCMTSVTSPFAWRLLRLSCESYNQCDIGSNLILFIWAYFSIKVLWKRVKFSSPIMKWHITSILA